MLIPRQLQQHSSLGKISVKNFNDSGLEVKPVYNKMPQHSHVNKLLHTAAAGNGVIDDVDGMLTPIKAATHTRRQEELSPQQDNNSASSKERTERNLWRNDEVLEMMFVMQQTKALDKLNDKQMKSENVFKEVESIMRKNGFVKKSHLQIWTKWKFLKSTYMTSRRNGVVPRMIPPEIYSELHQMVSGASECDTSTNGSINGDNSNVNGSGVVGSSGVETDSLPNAEEDDSFGMAHPIFGFRLGLVKHEPVDNGYDTVENNNDSLTENNPLEEISAPQAKIDKQKPEKEKPIEKVVVPHRGRGRPPKKLPWVSSTPNSTPTSTAAETNTQLPPLRVAPFAKATNATNVLAASRPPPPLTMPPTSRPMRVTNITNLSDNNKSEIRPLRLIQPKLLPKPQQQPTQPQSTQPIRLPKDSSVQSGRASSTPSPSYPKLKQVPMRKTPYSLRPDRAIPDLDASFSPPPAPEKQRKLEEVPSTSHLVMQSHSTNGVHENGNPRKRRFDQQQSQPILTKLRKIPSDDEEPQMTDRQRSRRDEHMCGKLMQTAIMDLSVSLRQTQTQMMREFFNKQHELLEKEHAFQMQQDRLIMETFHMQTQEIMSSVRDLVATIASDKQQEQQRVTSKKRTAKGRKLQNRHKERLLFANEESSQEMQEQATETEHDDGGQQQQMEQETEEMYTDEEDLNTIPDHNINDGNANLEEEMHNVFEGGDHNQENDEPLTDQTSSPFGQHQAGGNVEEEDDDDDDDDEDEDDDDDDDDEDSDSDDDDDDNESSQLVNGGDDDPGLKLQNMMSAELVRE